MAKKAEVEKLIVTNRHVMLEKYGAQGWAKINRAISDLIRNDKKRGLVSELVFLDDAAALRRAGGKAVKNVSDARQSKSAIDALYRYYQPDYLLLLGAPDVIPHILLDNPIDKHSDDDFRIPSDLPYACAAPYSINVRQYLSPTRVVGRLPDVKGGSNPDLFVRIIHHAIQQHPRPSSDYDDYFAVSAAPWKVSTSLSLNRIFGNDKKLIVVPPHTLAKKKYSEAQLRARIHFINCHGANGSPFFYGENPKNHDDMPQAFSSAQAGDALPHGALIAAECCYGAQLFDPQTEFDEYWIEDVSIPYDRMPVCMQYMLRGAAAYLGSTTTAYGEGESQTNADLVTQYFLRAVRRGASVGRAFLETRHRFLETSAPRLDPVELKTFAQFILLGDPSVHPVKISEESFDEALAGLTELYIAAKRSQRRSRREMLAIKGALLEQVAEAPEIRETVRLSPKLKKEFGKVLTHYNMKNTSGKVFGFSRRSSNNDLQERKVQYHVYSHRSESEKSKRPASVRILVFKIAEGKLVEVRNYLSKS